LVFPLQLLVELGGEVGIVTGPDQKLLVGVEIGGGRNIVQDADIVVLEDHRGLRSDITVVLSVLVLLVHETVIHRSEDGEEPVQVKAGIEVLQLAHLYLPAEGILAVLIEQVEAVGLRA